MAFRSQFTELMTRDMYGYFLERYATHNPVYPLLFEVREMQGGYDKNTSGIGLGQLSERKEGSEIVASNLMEGFTVLCKARTFSDSFFMTMEFVEDSTPEKISNVISQFAGTWAQGVTATKETFAAKFFNRGGYTAGDDVFNNTITGVVDDPTGNLIYDGKPFFALSGNNHPAKDGSTYYNSLGALSLSDSNLKTAYNLITNTNNRNERGEIIALMPDVLVTSPNLRFTAKALLESDRITGSANNDINSVQNLVSHVEWQYITGSDDWYLGKAKSGIVFYERKQPVIDVYQNEIDKKYYVTIDTRFGATVENWRPWVGANLSTS